MALQDQYKREKKEVKSQIKHAKSNLSNKQIENCKGNSKETWKVLKKIIPNNSITGQLKFDNVQEKIEEFNDFYANVGRVT